MSPSTFHVEFHCSLRGKATLETEQSVVYLHICMVCTFVLIMDSSLWLLLTTPVCLLPHREKWFQLD